MAWAFEVFASFDSFFDGGFWVIYVAVFFFIFGYFGARGSFDDPVKKGLELTGWSMLWGFILALTGIPSMWVGVWLIIGYGFLLKRWEKMKWQKWIVSFVSLCINFSVLVLVPEIVRPIFVFGLVVLNIFVVSEKKIRGNSKKENEESEKKEKKK
jgi:hypothetical protein